MQLIVSYFVLHDILKRNYLQGTCGHINKIAMLGP